MWGGGWVSSQVSSLHGLMMRTITSDPTSAHLSYQTRVFGEESTRLIFRSACSST